MHKLKNKNFLVFRLNEDTLSFVTKIIISIVETFLLVLCGNRMCHVFCFQL